VAEQTEIIAQLSEEKEKLEAQLENGEVEGTATEAAEFAQPD